MAYYVYLLASKKHGTLYLGVTNDIVRRVYEHKSKVVPGFTTRYDVDKLVWFEIYDDAITAIEREKELKKWRRDWKVRLIEEQIRGGLIFTRALQLRSSFRSARSANPESITTIGRMDSGPAPSGASRNDELRDPILIFNTTSAVPAPSRQ